MFILAHCDTSVRCEDEGYLNKDCICVCRDGTGNCQRGGPTTSDIHYNQQTGDWINNKGINDHLYQETSPNLHPHIS